MEFLGYLNQRNNDVMFTNPLTAYKTCSFSYHDSALINQSILDKSTFA